ncbi:MAG TPA: Asp-tRNA(Asn)/Glu-tRNA(Gln) amidotransferase subunit GatB [Alcanivoracaceae bacterium]|nr:Asp-tRNA(Asn)/Glu-tRNA(Gln) amidotransferase subunit GatB [Alcanivoracaceae bacterium]
MNSWETVIGLEVHVQLTTASKIFSAASTAFGAEPNSQASLIDLGMPGTIASVNKGAIEQAIKFGLAVGADINKRSVFERKHYFYPDSPKGYQTTQNDEPIVVGGGIDIELSNGERKTIRIHHAHLEEDAGKSSHEGFHGQSGIDLNRAGTPLIEVVTEPDMRSAEEAVAFARSLYSIVTTLGVCDGKMAQGSLRFDVNVSVRKKGTETLGVRTETKNLNSFRFMEACIKQEVERQIDILEDGGEVIQETRLYNGDTHTARSMRVKEDADDYRYFPCPDIAPVNVTEAQIQALKEALPELPEARKTRFISEYELSTYDAVQLTSDRFTADYFEAVTTACGDAKLAANWVLGDLAGALNQHSVSITDAPISAEQLAQLISRIKDGTISGRIAKQVFEAAWETSKDPDTIIEEQGLKQMSDSGELEKLVDQVIAENPEQVEAFRAAEEHRQKRMFGFFVGQTMRLSKGKANPQQVNELLQAKLKG